MAYNSWSPADIEAAKTLLGSCKPGEISTRVLPELTRRIGRLVTLDSLGALFRRLKIPPPVSFCRQSAASADVSYRSGEYQADISQAYTPDVSGLDYDDEAVTLPRMAAPPPAPAPAPSKPRAPNKAEADDDVRRLVDLVQEAPRSFEEACDCLGVTPKRCRELLEAAEAHGYAVSLFHDELHWRTPEPTSDVQETGIAPVVGERTEVAVISDLHFGSKHCGREQMKDFLSYVRDRGITEVLDPGDNLDGNYKFSLYEQSHRGFDEQAEDMYELFRLFPELTFRTIDGNHDDTLSESCGMQTGRALVERFRSNGLENIHYYGSRAATLNIGGANVMLWHPRGGGSYALSYKLQKKVESFAPGSKPDVLLTGHYHQACYILERGIHAFLCPTFQLPGGSFGNSLVGSPSVGGMILSWQATEERTLRRFVVERVSYYAGEKSRTVS